MSSGLQNKMYKYEVAPPAGVWEKIAGALDESELAHEFPAKLYRLEITPPLVAWENIKTSLFEGQPSIPERKKLIPLLRYAAAASIIGIIAWGGIQLLNKRSGDIKVAKQEVIQPGKEARDTISKKNDGITGDNIVAEVDEARNNAALEASKKTYAKLDMTARNRMKKAADNYFTAADPGNDPEEEPYRELHYAGAVGSALAHHYEINANSLADRYITLMTPDGNIIRMSKKLSDLVCCVSGEEQDEDCKDQLKNWRKKIAYSSITSSPDNVIDILNLVSSLQENH